MNNRNDVTEYAKSIFGEEIVKSAYQEIELDKSNKSTINMNTIEPQDACPVIVEFTNGKKFEIWSSEWGGVTKRK